MRAKPDPTAAALDPVIHPVNRLRVCAALAAAQTVDFAALQRSLGLTASALSKQVRVLVDAGYVVQDRKDVDSRRVWLRLTSVGRRAYRRHLAALQEVIDAGPAD